MDGVKVARYAASSGGSEKKLRGSAAVMARMAAEAGAGSGLGRGGSVVLPVGKNQLSVGASARGFVPGGAVRFDGGATSSSKTNESDVPSSLLRDGARWDKGMQDALRKEEARKGHAKAKRDKAAKQKVKKERAKEQAAERKRSKGDEAGPKAAAHATSDETSAGAKRRRSGSQDMATHGLHSTKHSAP